MSTQIKSSHLSSKPRRDRTVTDPKLAAALAKRKAEREVERAMLREAVVRERLARQRLRQWAYSHSPQGKYDQQRLQAAQRGIPFLLTFEEWLAVWKPHWHQRGSCGDCLVMARHGDVGPYSADNIKLITARENLREGLRAWRERQNAGL